MYTVELLHDEILTLRMNNQQPRYIYIGEFEYRELEERANRAIIERAIGECKDEFRGIEVVRVNRTNHINVTT